MMRARGRMARSATSATRFAMHDIVSLSRAGNEAHHSPRCRRDRAALRRARSPADQPSQDFLEEAEAHETRSPAVLRRYFAMAAAASGRSRDGHEALSERRRGGLFLHEAG